MSKEREEHTEHGVNATVIFWVVRDLRVLAEHDLPAGGDHAKFGDIDLDDSTFSQHT